MCFISGINVLDKKNELQKELERRKTVKQKKDDAEHQKNNRNSLEQRLDLQKEKLAQVSLCFDDMDVS